MNIKDVERLIQGIKGDIRHNDRAFEESEEPSLQLTIGSTDGKDWSWQTGDNSYTGGAYGYAFWSVQGVYRDTNCRKLAEDMVREVKEQISEAAYWRRGVL